MAPSAIKTPSPPSRKTVSHRVPRLAIKPYQRPESKELGSGHFLATVNYILEQHKLVEPLYQLDKAGNLSEDSPDKGRLFLEKQLLAGAQMLGDLWFTAWKEAPPDRFLQSYLAKRKIEKK